MVTEQTLTIARETASELRRRGESERAAAVEALITAVTCDALPAQQTEGVAETADLFCVDGSTLQRWVEESRLAGYRIGERLAVPKETVEEYVQRAGSSLDLDEVSDEEAARVVEERRRRA